MKILGLKQNPSFLQEDTEWFECDVKNSQELVNKLTFPFEAELSLDRFGLIQYDDNGFPLIVDPNEEIWTSNHFIIET